MVREFLQLLATAHECMPEKVTIKGQDKFFYQGPSPDEVALVEFAAEQGYKLTGTSDTSVTLDIMEHLKEEDLGVRDESEIGPFANEKVPNKRVHYEVFRRIEFNSDRKRMSILLRDPHDGKLK